MYVVLVLALHTCKYYISLVRALVLDTPSPTNMYQGFNQGGEL